MQEKQNKQAQTLSIFPRLIKIDTDLNIKCKTVRLLEYSIGENVRNFEFGDDFIDTSKVQPIKEKIGKMGFIKIRKLLVEDIVT